MLFFLFLDVIENIFAIFLSINLIFYFFRLALQTIKKESNQSKKYLLLYG